MLTTSRLLALATTILSATSVVNAQTPCSDGLHMIVARASTEKPGTGIIGKVANMTQDRIPGSAIVPVVYPATLTNYTMSQPSGVAAMLDLVHDYVDSCPGRPIALLGYSQGAQVVGDVICGVSEAGGGWTPSDPLPSRYGDAIVAVVQMGDPTHKPGLSWDVGTAKKPGTFNRQDTAACQPFASRIQSYCDFDDLYCAGGKSVIVHIGYVVKYGTEAEDFIVQKYNAMKTVPSATAGGASASATAGSSNTASRAMDSLVGGLPVALAVVVVALLA